MIITFLWNYSVVRFKIQNSKNSWVQRPALSRRYVSTVKGVYYVGTVSKSQSVSVDRMIKIGFDICFIISTITVSTIIIIINKKEFWRTRKTELTIYSDPMQVGIQNLVL